MPRQEGDIGPEDGAIGCWAEIIWLSQCKGDTDHGWPRRCNGEDSVQGLPSTT